MTKEAIFLSKRESLQNKETINPQLIHGNFFKNAEEKPDNVCVYFSDGTEYSYGYLSHLFFCVPVHSVVLPLFHPPVFIYLRLQI